MLPQEGIDRVADQGALAASAAQGQCLQSLPLRRGEIDLGSLPLAAFRSLGRVQLFL